MLNMATKGYMVVDGILYFEGGEVHSRQHLVVPVHLRQKILDENHDLPFSGHFPAKKMAQKLSQYFFWKGMKSDVYKKCSSCVTCAAVKGQGNHGRPPMDLIPYSFAPLILFLVPYTLDLLP